MLSTPESPAILIFVWFNINRDILENVIPTKEDHWLWNIVWYSEM